MLYVQPPKIVDPTTTILAVQYSSVQDAIDDAELLSDADGSPGVMVILPVGFIAEDLLIKKNVSLKGMGLGATVVQSLTIRPTSNTIGPQRIILKDITIGNSLAPVSLLVSNETAPSSGVFNPGMFNTSNTTVEAGLYIIDCELTVQTTINAINNTSIFGTRCLGNLDITNCYILYSESSMFGLVSVTSDDGLPYAETLDSDPHTYLASRFSTISQITLTSAGTFRAAFESNGSQVSDLIANDNTDITFYSGSALFPVLNGSGHIVTNYSGIPYTPTNLSDWNTAPTNIGAALDELAARLRAIE